MLNLPHSLVPGDAEGREAPILPLEGLHRLPLVRLEGKGEDAALVWVWRPFDERPLAQKRGLLEAFARLEKAPPEAYLQFAQRYGVLHLCGHELPGTHTSPGCMLGVPVAVWEERVERLSCWRHFARQVGGLLRIASNLRDGKLGSEDDWAAVYEYAPDWGQGRAPWWVRETDQGEPSLGGDRVAVDGVVNELLEIGGVRPRIWWWPDASTTTFTLDGPGTFSTLVVQLAFAVGASNGVAQCASCGGFYSPKRKPARGKRAYCTECRNNGEPQRDASRAYWQRKNPPALGATPSYKSARRFC